MDIPIQLQEAIATCPAHASEELIGFIDILMVDDGELQTLVKDNVDLLVYVLTQEANCCHS